MPARPARSRSAAGVAQAAYESAIDEPTLALTAPPPFVRAGYCVGAQPEPLLRPRVPGRPTADRRATGPFEPIPPAGQVVIARPHPAPFPRLCLVGAGPPNFAGASPGASVTVVGIDVTPAAPPTLVDAKRIGVPGQLVHRLTLRTEADTPTRCAGLLLRRR